MPDPAPWHAFYQSDLQSLWGLWIAPVLFGVYRALRALGGRGRPSPGVQPAAATFVDTFAIVFLIETLADPLCTGPLTRALGLADHVAGTAIAFTFVYLGDFRVFFLLFGVAALSRGRAVPIARALLWTLAVPVFAGSLYVLARAVAGDVAMAWLWVIYELSFLALILGFRARWVGRQGAASDAATRRFLGFVCLYVAAYYALWPLADLLVLVGGFDVGWALRSVPNQLYYAFFIPCIWWRFFSPSFAAR